MYDWGFCAACWHTMRLLLHPAGQTSAASQSTSQVDAHTGVEGDADKAAAPRVGHARVVARGRGRGRGRARQATKIGG